MYGLKYKSVLFFILISNGAQTDDYEKISLALPICHSCNSHPNTVSPPPPPCPLPADILSELTNAPWVCWSLSRGQQTATNKAAGSHQRQQHIKSNTEHQTKGCEDVQSIHLQQDYSICIMMHYLFVKHLKYLMYSSMFHRQIIEILVYTLPCLFLHTPPLQIIHIHTSLASLLLSLC